MKIIYLLMVLIINDEGFEKEELSSRVYDSNELCIEGGNDIRQRIELDNDGYMVEFNCLEVSIKKGQIRVS